MADSLKYVALFLLPGFVLSGCEPEPAGVWMKISGNTQGTYYNLTYLTPDSTNYQEKIEEILAGFDNSLSTYIDTSLISRFNQDEVGLRPDTYFKTCFNCAKEVFHSTAGAFDITVAPIVNAWGFGFTEAAEVNSALIDSLLGYVGMNKVGIRDGVITKDRPGVMLDMNAIAQGYAVDVLSEYLDSEGLENYLVEIGGELRTMGKNNRGTDWVVGIDMPIEGLQISGVQMQAKLEISGFSLATSGNYRRFYEKDGMKYSHTIDPETGYPVRHGLLSATVLAGDCMRADAFATALMVMGVDKSQDFLEQHPELEAYLIYNDDKGEYKVWYTKGFRSFLVSGFE